MKRFLFLLLFPIAAFGAITISVDENHTGHFISGVHDPVLEQDAATKKYADQLTVNFNAVIFKGVIDCSGNPNYPAADRGWAYIISVAGKIGGAAGLDVVPRDLIICLDNGTPSGNQATVGSHWTLIHATSGNTILGPVSSVDGDFVQWDGVTGLLVKDAGLSFDTDGTLAANSDLKIPSQKAVKTYVDAFAPSAAALTKTDDTNVTLTLGGTPATALLQATSLTLGWAGQLAVSRGGTGAATSGAHTFFGNNTGSTAAPGFHLIAEADLSLSDITTNDVTTSQHGFAPKSDGNAAHYLDGTGAYSTPAGAGTVTSFSAGTLSPLFTTSVANSTTTPALSFTLSNAGAHTFFANNTGSSGAPSFTSFVAKTDYWDTTDFVASGGSHAHGLVPDPGSSSGTTKFLREDATFAVPPGTGTGTVSSFSFTNGSGFLGTVLTATTTPALALTLGDSSDTTKKAIFDVSNVATSTTRTMNVPNANATFAQAVSAVASNWITSMSSQGVFTLARPAEVDLTFTDTTTSNASSTKHGFAPKSPADATQFLNGATNPAYANVKDSDLAFTDITTNNSSTSNHGFLKKLDNNAAHYMDGTGAWSTVSATVTAPLTLTLTDSATNTTSNILIIDHESSGTPAATFGAGFQFQLQSNTTANRIAGLMKAVWSTATDASRTSYIDISPVNAGALQGNALRIFGSNGVSVDSTTDPGTGILNAQTGYWVAGAASAQGRFLQSDGSKFANTSFQLPTAAGNANTIWYSNGTNMVQSTPTYPTAASPTAGNTFRADGTNWVSTTLKPADLGSQTFTRVTAQTAANSSIATLSVPASDSSYDVSMNMNVTAATAISTSMNCDYTDESNTARTMILPTTSLSGSFLSGGLIITTGAFETPRMHIRCKASTTITLYTAAGTFTSVTYTAEGHIMNIK